MKIRTYLKVLIIFLLISICAFNAFKVLLYQGFFTMHDDTQVARVIVMGKALRSGQFPVRWVSDLGYGYGYPIYNFYAPLPYYAGGFFYALGIDSLMATKITFLIAIIGAAITMFVFLSTITDRTLALAGATLYTYAPYHAVELYIRGALGEAWILIFLPILALGLWHIGELTYIRRGIVLTSIGLAGCVLSHTILGYAAMLFMICYVILVGSISLFQHKTSIKITYYTLIACLFGMGMSAFFWMPAMLEMNFTNVQSQIGSTSSYSDHFVCLNQLWDSPWGFGGSAPGCIDGLSFRLGKIHIIFAIISLGVVIIKRSLFSKQIPLIVSICIFTMLSVYLMLPSSLWIWNIVPRAAYVQYPWRFLTFSIFGLSTLSIFGLEVFKKLSMIKIIGSTVLIVLTIGIYSKLFIPQEFYVKSPKDFESKQELLYRVSKISDEYLPAEIHKPNSIVEIPSKLLDNDAQLAVDTLINSDTYVKLWITSEKDTIIRINKTYFPGWKYMFDGKNAEVKIVNGFPQIKFYKGAHTLELRFLDTPIRTIANYISFFTLFLLLFIYGKKNIN